MAEKASEAWIQTYTGRKFYPLAPKPEDVCLEDIAHALSMKCRYGGHVLWFYSVAQHSCMAAHLCKEAPAWGLLHDAAEAYLVDLARPLKPHMRGFEEAEERLLRVIAKRFGLAWPMPAPVHDVDVQLLVTERRDLLPRNAPKWGPEFDAIKPLERRIVPWTPEFAKAVFLETARKVAIAK